MKEQFIEFLKKHRALGKFKANIKEGNLYPNRKTLNDYLEISHSGSQFISGGFSWSQTKEKDKFWRNLDAEWIKIVSECK